MDLARLSETRSSVCSVPFQRSRFGLGGDGGFAGGLRKSLLDGAPREHGAFDALGEFADALEKLKVAELLGGGGGIGGNQIVEGSAEIDGFSAGFAF